MSVNATPKFAPPTLMQRSPMVPETVQRIADLFARVHAWLKGWPAADAARQQLEMMNDRELLDIGMTRVDVRRTAWGASPRDECYPRDWI